MTGIAARVLRVAGLPTVALAVGLVVVPSRSELIVELWLLLLLGLGAILAVRALASAYPGGPSPFDRRPTPEEGPRRFASLERLEREVTLGAATAHDAHFRVLPTLRAAATELLVARRGVDLRRRPDRAREILGLQTWELVRPDRPPPRDGRAPGLDRETLEVAVDRLERL